MMSLTTLQYACYISGSTLFLAGSLVGLYLHLTGG